MHSLVIAMVCLAVGATIGLFAAALCRAAGDADDASERWEAQDDN